MAVLEVKFSENGRERLGRLASTFHIILATFGLAIVFMGVYIRSKIEARISILVDYDHYNLLPHMLISVGSILIFFHAIGAKICYDCSFYDTRQRFERVLLPYIFTMLIFQLLILSAASMCFSHTHMLRYSFNHGISRALKKYRNTMYTKRKLDSLNLEFKCCGVEYYTDWFNVSWISTEFLNLNLTKIQAKMKNGEYYSDDVPFSCCDPESPRACIHHGVHTYDMHRNYNRTNVTLYKNGCRTQIMLFFERILFGFGGSLFTSLLIEWIVLILMRYLQTSILMAREWGIETCQAPGYLISQHCCDGGYTDLRKQGKVDVQTPIDEEMARKAELALFPRIGKNLESDDSGGEIRKKSFHRNKPRIEHLEKQGTNIP